MKIVNAIKDYLLKYRIRKCVYCGKIKFCEYINYKKNDRGIKGSFCKNCTKLSTEDIFLKLKDKQYYVFKMRIE